MSKSPNILTLSISRITLSSFPCWCRVLTLFKINDPTDEKAALTRIQACVREIKAWLNHNRLHLNDNKTEVLVITTPSSANKHSVTDVIVGDSIIRPTAVARNIGVMFDNELSLKSQVSKLCQVAFFYIRRIRSIRDCNMRLNS